jgi:flagellar basal body-associated protein FliL
MPGKKKKKTDPALADDDAPVAKSGKGKTMLLAAGLVLVGAAGQRFVFATPPQTILVAAPIDAQPGSGGQHAVDCAAALSGSGSEAAPHARPTGGGGATAELPSQTINLADQGTPRYLKVGIALSLGAGVAVEEFSAELPKASDVALRYFGQKTVAELQGSSRLEEVRTELTCLMQQAYAPADGGEGDAPAEPVVTEVLFTSFLIQ